MSIERLLFSLFAAGSLVSAIGVVALSDPVRGALSLIACFFSIACLYLLQAAELIAVLEVLVYAGAIMVLFVFVIMLVEHRDRGSSILPSGLLRRMLMPMKAIAAGIVAINMLVVIRTIPRGTAELPPGFGTAHAIGREFMGSFLFQFELTSVLLLIAIVGATVISRRDV